MSPQMPRDRGSVGPGRRRWLAALLVAYCGLILYATLRPFRFGWPADLFAGSRRYEWIPFTYPCPRHGVLCPWDKSVNLLAFVPLGVLLALLSGGTSGRTPAARLWRATAWGAALSLGIEITQVFLPTRYPSSVDLLMNALGTCLGAFLAIRPWRGSRGDP